MSLRTLNRFFAGEGKHARQTDTIWKIEGALGWEPGTARRVLEGGDPNGAVPDDVLEREYEDIVARAMKLDAYHRRRIALHLAVAELSEEDNEE